MATFNNKIQIARGNFAAKKDLAYGELFYDRGSKNLFIGAKAIGSETIETKRIGGADGLVLKGTISNNTLPTGNLPELIAGDTYFLTAPIYFKKNISPEGDVSTSEIAPVPQNPEEEKNLIKWEKDSIVIYLGADVSVPNSEVVYGNWLYVNSAFLKADHVKFDTSKVEVITGSVDDIADVQHALEYLFLHGLAYAGEVGTPNTPYTEPITMTKGSFIYFKGENGAVTINQKSYELKENSLVICQGEGAAIYTIPLGAANADAIGFVFTQSADYNDTYAFSSKNPDGSTATLATEADVDTVTKAIDWLNGKKADLKPDGKIPLEQIPSTLIGALQFKGTVDIDAFKAEVGAKDTYTSAELASYISHHLNSDVTLDEGDYVIFSKTVDASTTLVIADEGKDETAYNSGDWAIYLPTNPDPETMSDADHFERINASAAVDNVNGLMGSVNIAVSDELKLETAGQTITISNNTLLDDEGNVLGKHVPIIDENKMGTHVVKDSGLEIDRKAPEEGLTLTDVAKAIDITMKTSGDIVTTPKGTKGTEDVLSKFDADGSLIDSIVKNTNDDVLIGNGKEANVTIKTGTKLGIDVKVGANTNYFKFEDAPQTDAKGAIPSAEKPATLLDDASVIDCGEWI